MKLLIASALLTLAVSFAGAAPAHTDKTRNKDSEKTEKSTAVHPLATVTLCVMSGSLVVRGWDKNEVRVRSSDDVQLDFRRIDKSKDTTQLASRIDVMVNSKSMRNRGDCQSIADVEMDVPAGATVQLQTRDGDIVITGVATTYAGSQNGDIVITHASKVVEAGSVGGSIVLKESSGRVVLSSAGGGVDVIDLKSNSSEDFLEVGTVSGDINLSFVSSAKVSAKTVNGTVVMEGPLAKAGSYSFTSMGGDMVLAMPGNASFQLNGKVSQKSDLVSEFALKSVSESSPWPKSPPPPPNVKPIVIPAALYRINGVYGSGDATINVASFGGTLHLKKLK